MGMENNNGKRNGLPRRQGPEALKDFAQIVDGVNGAKDLENNDSSESMSQNDSKYAEIRARFEKREIPLSMMDYALGLKTLPVRDTKGQYPSREVGRIAALLDEYGPVITNEMRLAYKAHLRKIEKDPAYKASWEKSGQEWVAKGIEGAFVIIPFASEASRKTKDLSSMPPEILERVKRHPAAVNYTLAMFLRQMRDWPFEDERHRAFARLFADTVEEKAFRENREDRERSMYENAYWALLDLKVAEEVNDTKSKRSYPEIQIRAEEVAKHIQDFLDSEHIRRDTVPTLSGTELEKTEAELAARPTNIIRALGDRLFVQTRRLPIDQETIQARADEKERVLGDTKESTRLPGDLRFLSRIAGRLNASISQETSNARNDTVLLSDYLDDNKQWSEGAQAGFDIINKSISANLQLVEKVKETLRTARGHEEMEPRYAPVFDTHGTRIIDIERELHTAQTSLFSLWVAHSPSGKALLPAREAAPISVSTEIEAQLLEKLEKRSKRMSELLSVFGEKIEEVKTDPNAVQHILDLMREAQENVDE
ncbi:MAG: hypothetical protein WAZ27_03280 [Minisyncoccia bacterium]